MMQEETKDRPVLLFIGIILLLIGIYSSVRTLVNLAAFEKYPLVGVALSTPWSPAPVMPSYQREEDCVTSYMYTPSLYYKEDGITTRPATAEEKEQFEQQKQQYDLQEQSCVAGVQEARDASKINDVSQSLIFLLLGAGVIFYRRIFKNPFLRINL